MLQNIFWGSASITSPKWKRALPLGAIIRSPSILSRLFYRSIFIEVVTPLQDYFVVRLLENVPMSPIIDEKFSRGQSPLTPSPSSNKGPDPETPLHVGHSNRAIHSCLRVYVPNHFLTFRLLENYLKTLILNKDFPAASDRIL